MRRSAWVVVAAVVGLAGCYSIYSIRLVEAKRVVMGGAYSIEPQIQWAAWPAGQKAELWTVDGAWLQSIRFVNGVETGEAIMEGIILEVDAEKLFKSRADVKTIKEHSTDMEKLPKFRPDMTPNEILDLVVDTYVGIGAQKVQATNLASAPFGAVEGFRFDMTLAWPTGLEAQGLVAGAVVKQKLYLIVYTGTRVHHFLRHKEVLERLIASIRTN